MPISTHINFYPVNFENFTNLLGSKDEDILERALLVMGSRLRNWDVDSRLICSQIIRQVVFDGKFPSLSDDSFSALILESTYEYSEGSLNDEAILALFNKIENTIQGQWVRYHDCIEIYKQLASQNNISQEQAHLWQFLLVGRPLNGEIFHDSLWGDNYGYF